MEKSETCFLFGAAGCAGVVGSCADGPGVVVDALSPTLWTAGALGATVFFFWGFLATESGLNMSGFPTSFTSSSAFCPSGSDGPFFGAGRLSPEEKPDPDVDSEAPYPSSPSSLLVLEKAGSAPVLKFTTGLGLLLVLSVDADIEAVLAAGAVFLGAGRKEPKLLKRLAPGPAVFARFAGGSSSAGFGSGPVPALPRLTMILPEPEPERPMSFWNGFLVVVEEAAAGAGVGATGC